MTPSALHQDLHKDPNFGYDPWLSATPPASAPVVAAGTFTGADTIGADLNLLPSGLSLYGSYVDNFGGFKALQLKFKNSKAFLVSFTIFGNPALCADVETGAMHNSDLPHWIDNVAQKDVEGHAWVYTSASNLAAAKKAAGNRKVIWFSAHYGHGPHICGPKTCGFPQASWTQWDDKGASGQNIDRSVGNYLPTAPKPPEPAGGTWSFSGTYDPKANHFTIVGTPGKNVQFAQKKKVAKFTGTVDEHTGEWTIKRAGFLASLFKG